jgi:hypothetical protein
MSLIQDVRILRNSNEQKVELISVYKTFEFMLCRMMILQLLHSWIEFRHENHNQSHE